MEDVAALLGSEETGTSVCIGRRPSAAEGVLEILIDGLTFDLRGLAPARPAGPAEIGSAYGFASGVPHADQEGIELVPGEHIAGGARLAPVVRAMLRFAADLALRMPVTAVVWSPAGTVMEPRYFCRVVLNWLSGGAFPALGLTDLVPVHGGGVASSGLSYFTGQEMQLEGREGEPPAEAVKLAIRIVDHLTRHGPVTAAKVIEHGDLVLLAQPSAAGRQVWISRQDT